MTLSTIKVAILLEIGEIPSVAGSEWRQFFDVRYSTAGRLFAFFVACCWLISPSPATAIVNRPYPDGFSLVFIIADSSNIFYSAYK
jgi:hypothetical protein